jgi:predicted permease
MAGPAWWRRRRVQDINEEIDTHLEMATRDRIERGMSRDEARTAALREFGNVPLIQQTTREVWSWTSLEQVWQDVRFGARILRQAPGLSATAILLVALVVGGNTTIYSMVNSLLVSPAPGVTADRLVVLQHIENGAWLTDPFVSFPTYEDYARLSRTLRSLSAWRAERVTLGTDGGNFALFGGLVTGNYFQTLKVPIMSGRALNENDDRMQQAPVAVISHRIWRDRFGEAPDIVGRSVFLNGRPVSIVGVASAGFAGALRTPEEDLWLPIRAYYGAVGETDRLADRGDNVVVMAGTLAPEASLSQARAEFTALLSQLYAAYRDSFTTYAPQGGLVPLRDPSIRVAAYSGNALLPIADMAPRFLAIFSVITLLTLFVVSANVANLMMGRAVERQRDTAVRRSLGAPRIRLVRALVAEGATLAILAWAAACVMAWWMSRTLLRLLEPRPGFLDHARPDWTFTAYAMVLAAMATLAFSLGPSVRAWRLQVLPLLKAGEQGVVRGRSRVSGALVILQFALSVLLVTLAGLAYRSMSLFDSGDLGYQTSKLLLVTVRSGTAAAWSANPPAGDADRDAAFARIERVRERLTQTGNVESVSYGRRAPGAYFNATTPIWRNSGMSAAQAFLRSVGPDYLQTLGLAAVAGRDLSARDTRGGERVAVINEQLAGELFPGESPIGHTLLVGATRQPVTIVGIAPNARLDGPVHEHRPRYVLVAEQQLPGSPPIDPTFFIRHRGTVEAVTPLVARTIANVDASLPIVSMATMDARLAEVTVFETFLMRLLISFAAVSLFIAALGQYAVAMFNMRRRTRDFGVRIALGASASRIQRGVIREAVMLAAPGAVIGFLLSATIATALRAQLFGVTPVDPMTYGGVFVLLALTSLAASYLPAWRAARINVVEALRND